MTDKFTPGPWFITNHRTKYIEARIGGGMLQEIAAVGPTIADDGYGEQKAANAALIAAAPELLRELERALDSLEYIDLNMPTLIGYGVRKSKIASARAAIAKARGL